MTIVRTALPIAVAIAIAVAAGALRPVIAGAPLPLVPVPRPGPCHSSLSLQPFERPQAPPNTLTAEAKNAGWRLLFDGKTLEQWRGYKQESVPAGWSVQDGAIALTGKAGDLITRDQFQDFELQLEWKISPAGNSGIFFHVTEGAGEVWETGPELQVLDNTTHADGKNPETSAASNYALQAPTRDATRPVGEWNEVRLVVKGPHVEHWLNGLKVVEYELWSPEWESRVKASKFKEMPTYGRARRGHIALQDHGNPVWYRSIRVKTL